jgi:hypothetical protein
VPFLASDLGNFFGGGVSSALIKRGWSVGRARKIVIVAGGFGVLALVPAAFASSFPLLLACFAVATFSYAAMSTMAISLPADLFHTRAVGSVAGMSGTGAGTRHDRLDLPDRRDRGPLLLHSRSCSSRAWCRCSRPWWCCCSSAIPPLRPRARQGDMRPARARPAHRPRVLVLAGPRLFRSFFDAPRARRSPAAAASRSFPGGSVGPRLRRLLPEAEALVTTWDSPRFGEELVRLAPRLRLVAHCGGEVKGRFARPLFSRADDRERARTDGAVRGRARRGVLLMAVRRVDEHREALRRRSNAVYSRLHLDGAGHETLRGRTVGPARPRPHRPGHGPPC